MFWRRNNTETPDFIEEREHLVNSLASRIDHEATLDALRAVPRHEFVPPDQQQHAYEDRPLPIGDQQTISAPHMVAIMTDQLALEPGERVLEIGTGCGYHAAVTAELVGSENVYSVEYHKTLGSKARDRLRELGYANVSIRIGDGHAGWAAHAPYDATYITCHTPEFPQAIVEQVRPDGRLLAPLSTSREQQLVFARKEADGTLTRDRLSYVRFVPMKGNE